MVDPDTGAPRDATGTGATVRLNKVLAHAGVA